MKDQYVDISPELLGKADPDQAWIERELDRIDPWRSEQGHDGADTAALRKLVLELRGQQATGGPAFPSGLEECSGDSDAVRAIHTGMTMRDYFAAKAMQSLITSQHCPKKFDGLSVSQAAYRVANAMLEARKA